MSASPAGQRVSSAPLAQRRQATIELEPTRPFAFDATFHKPDHFPSQDTAWEPFDRRGLYGYWDAATLAGTTELELR